MEYLKTHFKNIMDFKEKIKINHIFILLTSFYILFSSISPYSGFLALFCAVFFYLSYIVGEKLYYVLNLDDNSYNINYLKHYKFGLILLSTGILFIFLDLLWVRGIPLFEPLLRKFLNVPFTALSRLLIVGWAIVVASNLKLSKLKIVLYSIIFSGLIMLLGYRTNAMVLFLSILFITYYSNKVRNKELVISTVGIFLVLLLLSILRLYMLGSGGNPIFSRVDLTMSIYDIIVNNFNGVFNGILHYSAIYSYIGTFVGPRTIVANSIGVYGVTITPTIFGAVIGDYGILGIIPYFGILGLFLGLLYKIAEKLKGIYLGIYGVIMAYLLISIETGILDFDVILYFTFGALLCLYYILLKTINKFKK